MNIESILSDIECIYPGHRDLIMEYIEGSKSRKIPIHRILMYMNIYGSVSKCRYFVYLLSPILSPVQIKYIASWSPWMMSPLYACLSTEGIVPGISLSRYDSMKRNTGMFQLLLLLERQKRQKKRRQKEKDIKGVLLLSHILPQEIISHIQTYIVGMISI